MCWRLRVPGNCLAESLTYKVHADERNWDDRAWGRIGSGCDGAVCIQCDCWQGAAGHSLACGGSHFYLGVDAADRVSRSGRRAALARAELARRCTTDVRRGWLHRGDRGCLAAAEIA